MFFIFILVFANPTYYAAKGLKVKSELDEDIYEKGIKVPDEDFKKINIIKDEFHGEWNYTIRPNSPGQM